ncbi:MAG: PTS sugar transporter subunit IIB [Gemmatimonadaceae bacterium]|nr:PTS sugar transporter subunit IIB [Gemmatimonadaceae bacterium]NUR19879.1 PTS sugar transporter subunit IIB [Gemmatimonadaceae bacterium]NUS97618.1 PTS sugar transporter subunit IIB [Gemmatimonadaceae bacterium]
MPLELFRIDDRLIHGQVVVGWGQPMRLGFIVLVDDEVAASEWERELYRMGVPPEVDVVFETVEGAAARIDEFARDPRPGILLTGDVDSMARLAQACGRVRTVNLGGIHHRAGRAQRLRYVFLAPEEEQALRALEQTGIAVTAQDVPGARPVPLHDVLAGKGE